jgi:hypothetical protein
MTGSLLDQWNCRKKPAFARGGGSGKGEGGGDDSNIHTLVTFNRFGSYKNDHYCETKPEPHHFVGAEAIDLTKCSYSSTGCGYSLDGSGSNQEPNF